MNDLDLIERIAEIFLECDYMEKDGELHCAKYVPKLDKCGLGYEQLEPYLLFNPLTDKALNCELRDKYEVELDYDAAVASIYGDYGQCHKLLARKEFASKEEIPRAVLLCIIEAKAND